MISPVVLMMVLKMHDDPVLLMQKELMQKIHDCNAQYA